jgi:predicted esterase
MRIGRWMWMPLVAAAALCLEFGVDQARSWAQVASGTAPTQPDATKDQPSAAPAQPEAAPANRGAAPARRGGRGPLAIDPRVQRKTYHFEDTNEDIPYAVFVSSKVSPDKKNPLIVALHGLGGNPESLLRGKALELAEEGGYILVGPMGYNSGGWYGIPARGRGAGRGFGAPGAAPQSTPAPAGQTPAAGPAAPAQTAQAAGEAPAQAAPAQGAEPPARGANAGRGAFGGRGFGGGGGGGTAETDPAKVRELSEKDVMNVLKMVREQYNVDDNRIYLMGHSMGGAGALYLGVKDAPIWAAIGAVAPAAFGLRPETLAKISDMPLIIIQGDADTTVSPAGTRRWADKAKELNMKYEYHEIPGGDHGSVINTGMPDIFKFFAAHTKAAR